MRILFLLELLALLGLETNSFGHTPVFLLHVLDLPTIDPTPVRLAMGVRIGAIVPVHRVTEALLVCPGRRTVRWRWKWWVVNLDRLALIACGSTAVAGIRCRNEFSRGRK